MSRTVILCNLQNVSFENEMVCESQFFSALSDYIYMHSCDLEKLKMSSDSACPEL